MPSFSEMPEDVVQLILFHMGKRDVSAVSCACKRLRELTVPCLYDTIIWTWNMHANPTELCNPPIHLLLRSIVETLQLGAYVKHLSFRGTKNKRIPTYKQSPGTIWAPGEQPKLSASEFKVVEDFVHAAQLPLEKPWIAELETGNVNVFVALVLSQLSNLRTLYLGVDFHTDTKFLGLLFKHVLFSSQPPARRLSAFPNLQHVEFPPMEMGEMPSRATVDTEQVTSLLYLPAIETIDAVLFRDKRFSWPGDKPPCALTLTTLNLPCCEADEDVLVRLLSVTPNLQALRYDHWSDVDPPKSRPTHFVLAKLSLALRQVRTTLKHLSLSIVFYANTSIDVGNRSPYYGIKNNVSPL